MRCIVLVMACLISLSATAAAGWSSAPEALEQLRNTADVRWKRSFDKGTLVPRTTSVDLVALALDGIASGYDADHITQALEALRGMQDANPLSKTYGNIHWYSGDKQITDRNGVEFVVRQAGLLWLLYADQLSPAQRAPLQQMLELAKTGITRHGVAVSYTNIHLMKTWNLVALGDGLHDADLSAQAQAMLRDWLAYTARFGITEYLSPTYYAISLESLALIANLAHDPVTRQLARDGLDVVWGDMALNWYAPAERLGGTHSRDYDRLFNVGGINELAASAGWVPGKQARTTGNADGPYAHFAYSPPSAAASRWLAGPLPRFISSA
ncbi:MAG: hypothetical protein JWL63_3022 [Rhodocyclales bacterium]|nr:hypothetical protein [Rhodocyclales bacterium]